MSYSASSFDASAALSSLGQLQDIANAPWLADYQQASFRGVPFLIRSHERAGGRRVAAHEYPFRDVGSAEDMGRRQITYRLRAYVVGSPSISYFPARDALQAAFDAPGTGTLVHPFLGSVTVLCATATLSEGEAGNSAYWDLEFVDSGVTSTPAALIDTQSSFLSGVGSWAQAAVNDYAIGAAIAANPGVLLGAAQTYLGGLAASLTGLPVGVVSQIGTQIAGLVSSAGAGAGPVTSVVTGATGDPVAVAVTDVFFAAASAAANNAGTEATSDPVSGQVGLVTTPPSDPSYGLADYSTYASGVTNATPLQAQAENAMVAQFTALVQGAAVAATCQVFASTEFPYAQAAATAASTLLGLLDAQTDAAAAAGDDGATAAWMGLTGLALTDLNARIQQLPALVTYVVAGSLPACVLAQLLYSDATEADALFALNNSATYDPGFMPLTGLAVAATV
jgi:prophage DNA circulation protein